MHLVGYFHNCIKMHGLMNNKFINQTICQTCMKFDIKSYSYNTNNKCTNTKIIIFYAQFVITPTRFDLF